MGESSQEKKLRVITVALIVSGALNIGLIATGIFTKESPAQVAIRPSNLERFQPETCLERTIAQMEKLSFHELVSYLTNRDAVDEGYLKRDLSLSCLVAFHHFHLEKALSFSPIQRRPIQLSETVGLELFPGLTNEQFEGIIRFAYEEKWPLTSAGLFKLLKKWPETKDESLVQAFLVTPEFHALAMLFQKSESPQLVGSLIHLISEGSWELLDQFTKQQAQLFDLSVERRRSLLLSYLAVGSKTAAQILLNTDFAFVSKRLEDQGIIRMLSLLTEKSPEAERLCLELLRSPRSDAIWTKAASNLYLYAGENPPSQMSHNDAIARFAQTGSGTNLSPAPQSGNNPQTKTTPTNQKAVSPQSGVKTPQHSPEQSKGSDPQNRATSPQGNSTIVPLSNDPTIQKPSQKNTPLTPSQQKGVPSSPNSPSQRITPIPPKGPVHSHEITPPDQTLGFRTSSRQHVVKEGESLWKISKLYNVKVDEIVQANQMEKDRILPGMVLVIP